MEIEDEDRPEKKLKQKELEKQMELEEREMNAFMDEIEQDKYMRQQMNLYRNEEVIEKGGYEGEMDEEMVQLGELMKELEVKEEAPVDEKDVQQFINEIGALDLDKKD